MNALRAIRTSCVLMTAAIGMGFAQGVAAQSLNFNEGSSDYEMQQYLPTEFGQGEFTLEVSVLLDNSYSVGHCSDGTTDQAKNWCSEDPQPYSNGSWWYKGNFLLDGHNNNDASQGTFSLQVYGGGRIRWLLGDGQLRAVQAWPATETDSLLDGQWHKITLVRRYSAGSATLEMYIDGELIDSSTAHQVNMQQWWASWSGFPSGEEGWFWGAEKQAALGTLNQYEDFKGLVDDKKFYSRAKSATEIAQENDSLVAVIRHREDGGNQACDIVSNVCSTVVNTAWSAEDAPAVYNNGSAPPPPPVAACSNSIDDDNDGLVDLADPGCTDANDDDETDPTPPPPPPSGETRTIDFESSLGNYPWANFSGWSRDTVGYAGNPTATLYPNNYSRFPQETASFTFSGPQVLTSLDIASTMNGDIVITTDTESVTLPTSANTPETLTTGFSDPTTTVTIGYVGGNFGIDNIVTVD